MNILKHRRLLAVMLLIGRHCFVLLQYLSQWLVKSPFVVLIFEFEYEKESKTRKNVGVSA